MYETCQNLPVTVAQEESSFSPPLTEYFSKNETALRELLYRHGAILFTGFGVGDEGAFGKVAARMASPLMDYRGGVARRRELGNKVYNSTEMPPERTLAPHNEKSYSARHPDLVLFCCAMPALTGGETPLLDGRRIWQRLSKPLQHELRTRRIAFVQNLHGGAGAGKSWMTAFQTQDREEVEALLLSMGAKFSWEQGGSLHVEETLPAFKVHPVTGAEALFCPVDTWYRSASEFGGGRAGADRAAYAFAEYCRFEDGEEIDPSTISEIKAAMAEEYRYFQWRRGDVLLVDNRIVLHGRSSYTGDRLVLVAMGTDAPSRKGAMGDLQRADASRPLIDASAPASGTVTGRASHALTCLGPVDKEDSHFS